MGFKSLSILALYVLLTACTTVYERQPSPYEDETDSVPATLPCTMRVQVTEDLSAILLASPEDNPLIGRNGVIGVKPTFYIGGKFEKVQRKAGLHLWFDLETSPETRAADLTSSMDGIVEAEPVYIARSTDFKINDPGYVYQWHYHNTGSGLYHRAGVDIGLQEAWELYGIYGNSSVIVGVVDLGIDYNHEDLRGNMWVNEAEFNGAPGVDDDGNGYIDDIYGYNFVMNTGNITPEDHGTHVAGTVAAVNNNGIGVAGVAGGNYPQPGVRLMSIQNMDAKHSGGDIVREYQYAAENGAVIMQNSWSYTDNRNLPSYAKTAIDYFIDNAGMDENGNQTGMMKGGLVVFAAGNESRDYDYPAMYERVVAVASLGPTGKAASYTNYGPWVDVCAPGGDRYGKVHSTLPGNLYGGMTGTSMACPHVSGMAALLLSEFGGPGFTCDMLRDLIEYSTDRSIYEYNKGMEGMLGTGLINIVNAIASMSKSAPETPEIISARGVANSIVVNASIPEDPDDKHAAFFNVFLTSAAGSQSLKIDSAEEFRLTGLEFNTEYTLQISAMDRAGNVSGLSNKVTVNTVGNNPPLIKADSPLVKTLTQYQAAEWIVSFEEEDMHGFEYSYEAGEKSAVYFSRIDGSTLRVHVTGPSSALGEHKVNITATDEYGASSTLILTYITEPNHGPVLVKPVPDICMGDDRTAVLDIADHFKDEDGDNLRFKLQFKGNSLGQTASGTVITMTAQYLGLYNATLDVSDSAGETVSCQFKVLVRDSGIPCDIYPNPVNDWLNIRTSADGTAIHARVVSRAGKVVAETDTESGPFSPAMIDFRNLAPGSYGVEVTVGSGESAETVSKVVIKQ